MRRRFIVMASSAAMVAGLSLTAAPLAASASSGNNSTSSTSSFVLDGDPAYGGIATFSATYSPMKWVPEESVSCVSNGQDVYLDVQTGPSNSTSWTNQFSLWSQTWADAGGGSADCTAQLYYYTWQGKQETGVVYLGTTTFVAS